MSYSNLDEEDVNTNLASEPFVEYSQSSPLANKSFAFAARIVELVRQLQFPKKNHYSVVLESSPREFVISRQLIRCGTSIGAQIQEGIYAQSTADFISKMSIGLKEAHEAQYWLRLLKTTGYISSEGCTEYLRELEELLKMLTASIKTAKNRLNTQ